MEDLSCQERTPYWDEPYGDNNPKFKYNLLKVITHLHDVSTGIGGDPGNISFEYARWLQWKLSVWENVHSTMYSNNDFEQSLKGLCQAALEFFKDRCCRGIYENYLKIPTSKDEIEMFKKTRFK
jgi:hypothetical protein